MPTVKEAYEALIQRFVAWAQTVPDIRGAVIVGSRARVEHPADEWSDLDLIVVTTNPAFYINTTGWLGQIGTHWLTFVERTATGDGHERRVMFEGALDVDFVPVPAELFAATPITADLDIVRRGVRVVLDKDGMISKALRDITFPDESAQPPDEPTYLNVVHDFWYHAIWSAKKLRRGELWTVNGCINNYMKWQCVLPMLMWHARSAYGWKHDTWMNGRFVEQWADPRAVVALPEVFGRCERGDLWRALFGTMDLFRWLATETAERLEYAYPIQAEARVVNWVRTCFEERDSS
jgi:aminoglycoside 6-adenylyltransferase